MAPTPTPTATPVTPVPTATPTPTPTPFCTEWTLTCPSGSGGCNYSYTDCNGATQSGVLPGDFDVDVCVLSGTTPTITGGSANNTGVSCTSITPTPTVTPVGPTLNSYTYTNSYVWI